MCPFTDFSRLAKLAGKTQERPGKTRFPGTFHRVKFRLKRGDCVCCFFVHLRSLILYIYCVLQDIYIYHWSFGVEPWLS
jgi:hypothetical protein